MDPTFFRADPAPSATTTLRAWWLLHAAGPALAFALLFAAMRLTGDAAVAGLLYDPAAGWLLEPRLPISHALYVGERQLIMAGVLAGLGVLLAGVRHSGARRWRRATSYMLACLAITTALVSLGKHATNVDCPRAQADYGGRLPPVGLLEDRPDAWSRAQCFPAGHSSAAFSIASCYFVLGALRPRWRRRGLAAALVLGFAFAATQWARGMHVPSHDVCSAAIAWAVALGAYTVLYRRRL